MKLNRIKAVLSEKGISQTWLAKRLDKSFSMVNAYACNRIQPNLDTLQLIAEILQVDLKYLITDKKDRWDEAVFRSKTVWLFLYLPKNKKSSKWLAEQLGKDRATVSKWVTNTMQPDARNLLRIAEALNIDAGRLLNQKHLNNEGNRYYPTDKTWRGQ